MALSHVRATCTLAFLLGLSLACANEPPGSSDLPNVPGPPPARGVVDGWQLRIKNTGPLPIRGLMVWFPRDQIAFGDVPVGATTDYRPVPGGIFRYAAFRYEHAGRSLTQPVIDWVGEVPVMVGSYTYELSVEQSKGIALIVGITNVVHDW